MKYRNGYSNESFKWGSISIADKCRTHQHHFIQLFVTEAKFSLSQALETFRPLIFYHVQRKILFKFRNESAEVVINLFPFHFPSMSLHQDPVLTAVCMMIFSETEP
jgi:hypothetical protein